MNNQYSVYIMCNNINNVLYTGVTNNLKRRIYEHKKKLEEGFTKRYNINKLVYFEVFDDIEYAISREKQIKNYSRKRKMELIETNNSKWHDLYESL